MTKKQIGNELKELTDQLIQKYHPEKIILFGSWAWGEPDEHSDVDLAIIKEGVEQQRPTDRKWELDRTMDTKIAVDWIVYTPYEYKKRLWLEDPFVQKIHSKGSTIYER